MHSDGDAIAYGDIARVTNGSSGVCRGDRVPARQDGQGRHGVEACHLGGENRAALFDAPTHRRAKTNLERPDGTSCGGENGPRMTRSHATFELRQFGLSFRKLPTERSFEAHLGLVELLLSFGQEMRGRAHASSKTIQVGSTRGQTMFQRAIHALVKLHQKRLACGFVRYEQLGGLRRRCGPRIRDEVGEGRVDLVSDGAHDGHGQTRDFAHERFVVVRREIIRRTSTAAQNDHFDFGHPREHVERPHHGLRCAGALHGRASEQDPRCAATK